MRRTCSSLGTRGKDNVVPSSRIQLGRAWATAQALIEAVRDRVTEITPIGKSAGAALVWHTGSHAHRAEVD